MEEGGRGRGMRWDGRKGKERMGDGEVFWGVVGWGGREVAGLSVRGSWGEGREGGSGGGDVI